jgi:protein TonB
VLWAYEKLNFNIYIVLSIVSHLLFMSILGITHTTTESANPIFDVKIVEPPKAPVPPLEAPKPPAPKKIKPPLIKRTPPTITRRPRPPAKDVLPETLLGEGTGVPLKGGDDANKKGQLSKLQKGQVTEGVPDRLISPPEEEGGLPSGREGGSSLSPSQLFDKKIIEKFARKTTPAKKGLSFDTSEFKHRGYMRMLKEKIENIWKYPQEAAKRGISGDLHIKFSIKKDGSLGEVELLRTSGYRDLDKAAIKALQDAEPYWPLPDDWKNDVLEITGHFIYVYGATFIM